jgi:ABC-2 type transport system permease protein
MTMARIRALVRKEFLDLARNRTVLLPVVLVTIMTLLIAFGIAIALPAMTGEALGEDTELVQLSTLIGASDELSGDGRIQLFLFHQFLLLFLVIPITGAMALAAHAVVGEKQARTLEPLLATPVTTFELLTAKVLGAALPGIALMVACFAIYVGAVAIFAERGVWLVMLTLRSLALVFVMGPLAALLGLQLAVCASSRVNDARSAQQLGALIIILPIAALQIAQFIGGVVLTAGMIVAIAVVLCAGNAVLMSIAIRLFDRESILTRWK